MANKLWKAIERKVASRLGGRRVPVSGRQRGDAPDIEHYWLAIEVKQRKSTTAWIYDALDQAQKSQTDSFQLPIVVVHETGRRHDDDVVMMTLKDFQEWFGKMSDYGYY